MRTKAVLTLGLFGALTGIVAAQPLFTSQEELAAVARAERAQARTEWPRLNPPRPLPSRPVTFPPYEIRKMANGLQVVIVSQHEQPAISVRMIIRAGAAQDPKNKYGLAMMTATLLDQGAGTRTAEQIAEEIDFVGGALGTGAGTDLSYLNAVVMKDSYGTALDLLADLTQRPTFATEEIERQRQQALSALKVSAEDPDSVAGRVINRLIYGFHPYGLPGAGTADSLTGMTRQDFVDFHQKYYVPNNALIAVVGDIVTETISEAISAKQQTTSQIEKKGSLSAAASALPFLRGDQVAKLGANVNSTNKLDGTGAMSISPTSSEATPSPKPPVFTVSMSVIFSPAAATSPNVKPWLVDFGLV